MKWFMTDSYYKKDSKGQYYITTYKNLENERINNIVLSYGTIESFNSLGYSIKINLNPNRHDFSHFVSNVFNDYNESFSSSNSMIITCDKSTISLDTVGDLTPIKNFIVWADDKIEGFSADFRIEIIDELKLLRSNLMTKMTFNNVMINISSNRNLRLNSSDVNKLLADKNNSENNNTSNSTSVTTHALNTNINKTKAPINKDNNKPVGVINNTTTIKAALSRIVPKKHKNNINKDQAKNYDDDLISVIKEQSKLTATMDDIDLSVALDQSKITYNAEEFVREKNNTTEQNLISQLFDVEDAHNFSDPDSDYEDFSANNDPFKYNEEEALQSAQEISKNKSDNSSLKANVDEVKQDDIVYKHTSSAKR